MDELGYHDPDRYDQYEAINLKCWRELEAGLLTQNQLKLARFVRFFDRYPVPGDPRWAAERFVTLLGQQSILLPHALETVADKSTAKGPLRWVTFMSMRTNLLVYSSVDMDAAL